MLASPFFVALVLGAAAAWAQTTDLLASTIADLALASRILAQQGVVDAFGHISARHPTNSSRFLLSRNLAPAQVTPADVLEYNIADASPVDPNAPNGFIERFIHSELYKKFGSGDGETQVQSVVHFHAKEVLPFSVLPERTMPFRAVNHLGSFLGASPAPNFDIASHFGPSTDMLVRSTTIGASLASLFKPTLPTARTGINSTVLPFVLMRGHGGTVVGPSIELAVFRSVYTKVTAEVLAQTAAVAGGLQAVDFMSAGECEAATATLAAQATRAFNLWGAELAGMIPDIVPT
ncbi:hypothetical protein EXIGLDRAFT_706989 [Exidia glandulosa HHB12029]|uniref:Class II aldolase/adducin N-terminal domain-containing protein n=1 Tax=Exidia glandulosa HHB12029 TaxID=1314781 RepID=A0A166AVN2_EXIGL|nr:hypothetical protein EXIGLDRAFT_706989 [Exidia glandulosa HHB12029]